MLNLLTIIMFINFCSNPQKRFQMVTWMVYLANLGKQRKVEQYKHDNVIYKYIFTKTM